MELERQMASDIIKKGFHKHVVLKTLIFDGAGGENRTLMGSPPRDFESRASTNFTTPAFF